LLAGGGGRFFIPLILGPPFGFGVGTDAGKRDKQNGIFQLIIISGKSQILHQIRDMSCWYRVAV
jgi:hypothetical protein